MSRWIAAAVAALVLAGCSQPDPKACDHGSPQYLECVDAQQALGK